MAMTPDKYSEILSRAYNNVLQLEETKRKYTRTTTSIRGRNAMEFIYGQAPEGKGSRTQREIADFLKISRPSCTTLIKKLESIGYVERRRSEGDEREVNISLTRKGRLVTVIQCKHRNRIIDEVMSEMSEHEKEIIYKGFTKLNGVLTECTETMSARDVQ